MCPWCLLVLLLLPGLPRLPAGSELRLVSPDLRTVYGVWKVEDHRLVAEASALPAPVGRRVRLLFQVGGQIYVYSGVVAPGGDVWVTIQGQQVSLILLLTQGYHLQLRRNRILPEGP